MKTSATFCAGTQSKPESTVTVTVGTAGHIDHGKTALVKMLTGCDCDTLPEEKQRGMTIDLGFATCTLPDNRRVGIVDVPGHERFIHNMVAGASGIDMVMLVIAADDGIMPQTLEHFHIVRLLGINSGLIALTKVDLVTPDRVEDVTSSIRALVAGSFLDGAPIIPISSKTGQGFDAFYTEFVNTVDKTARRNSSGAFRMHIESSFVVQGLGSIVSGIPRCGTIKVGDTLELLPGAGNKRVRGLQVYGQDALEGTAGECVAVKLSDLSHGDATRGMVLATPGYFSSATIINAKLHVIPHLVRPLKPRSGIRIHIGTAEVIGYMVLPEAKSPPPGSEVYVQFQLKSPVVAAPGDYFVARLISPVQTIGGGTIVSTETVKMRRSHGDFAEKVEAREKAFDNPVSALGYALTQSGNEPKTLTDLAKSALLNIDAAREYMKELTASGAAVALPGDRFADVKALAAVRAEVMALMTRLHDAAPLRMGFAKIDILRGLKSNHLLIDKAFEQLLSAGELASNATGLLIPSRAPQLSPAQTKVADKICALYKTSGFASPRRDELPAMLGIPATVLDPIVVFLIQIGTIVEICDKVILHKDILAVSRDKLVAYLKAKGSIESGAFKDVLGTTRKYSIPILEYWDTKGLTKRVGNVRTLRPESGVK